MGWLIIPGIILFFIGLIVVSIAAESYDGEVGIGVGVVMVLAGIVLFIVGIFASTAENQAADAAGIKQVTEAAESQDLTITDPGRTTATVIGNKCTIPADLVDGKLVLRDSDPAIVLTPDYVDLVCQGTAR